MLKEPGFLLCRPSVETRLALPVPGSRGSIARAGVLACTGAAEDFTDDWPTPVCWATAAKAMRTVRTAINRVEAPTTRIFIILRARLVVMDDLLGCGQSCLFKSSGGGFRDGLPGPGELRECFAAVEGLVTSDSRQHFPRSPSHRRRAFF